MTKIKMTIFGPGGELSSTSIDVPDPDDADELINKTAAEILDSHVWGVGDTFTINEDHS